MTAGDAAVRLGNRQRLIRRGSKRAPAVGGIDARREPSHQLERALAVSEWVATAVVAVLHKLVVELIETRPLLEALILRNQLPGCHIEKGVRAVSVGEMGSVTWSVTCGENGRV